jgi:hypothetical protein
MDGQMWDATLEPAPEGAPEGRLVLVLSNEELLWPDDAEFGEFTVVEATDAEREALRQAGYAMPDWTPEQAPTCLAYLEAEPETETRAEESDEKK